MRSAPDAALVSLTRRHGMEPLQENWDTTEAALRQFTNRSGWSRFQKRHGIDGYSSSIEVTLSELGWNVHVHMLMTFSHKLPPEAQAGVRGAISTRWCTAVASVGHDAHPDRQAVEFCRTSSDRERDVRYVTKQHLLHHAPDSKQGRYPADLLAGAANGDVDDTQAYREYLDEAFGRPVIRAYGRLSSTANTN